MATRNETGAGQPPRSCVSVALSAEAPLRTGASEEDEGYAFFATLKMLVWRMRAISVPDSSKRSPSTTE